MGAFMSRKNTLETLMPAEPPTEPLVCPVERSQHVPAVKKISRILGAMTEQSHRAAQHAEEIQRQLATGEHVVSIDTNLIDPSPIRDRIDDPNSAYEAQFREEIATDGQKVPVLLRPNNAQQGRFITVYGHRRIAAVRVAGKPVLAIVRNLTDEEALIEQGRENNARLNTSFIEKSLYAKRLRQAGMTNVKIAEALSISKTLVTFTFAAVESLSDDIVLAIGPAPEVGRRRWEQLAEANQKAPQAWRAIAAEPSFAALPSNERFQKMFDKLTAKPATTKSPGSPNRISDLDGEYAVVRRSAKGDVALTLPKGPTPRVDRLTFPDWLEQRLASIREDWRAGR
jgi:ParB family transcriptional regulator, chromosome partitioning protein